MKLKISIIFLVASGALIYFIFKGGYLGSKSNATAAPSYKAVSSNQSISDVMPTMDLRDYAGNKISVDKNFFSANKKIVIHMWASWCGPCVGEVPELIKYSKKNPDTKFIVISMDDYVEDITKFMKSFPDFNSQMFIKVWDYDKKISKFFNVDRLPMSILIDSSKAEPQYLKTVVNWERLNF